MPTYEYQCSGCKYYFERFQKITDTPLKKCPKCGNKVIRLISGGSGFIFKGSGFYITDYVRNNNSLKSLKKDKNESLKNDEHGVQSAKK
jgi:putative FmdB family regulatory protein